MQLQSHFKNVCIIPVTNTYRYVIRVCRCPEFESSCLQ
ncbi:hypothetical protein AX774_g8217, partial [Zancudomyces culisetae]